MNPKKSIAEEVAEWIPREISRDVSQVLAGVIVPAFEIIKIIKNN